MRLYPLAALTLLVVALNTHAQGTQPVASPSTTISVDAKLVVVPAVVRDKKGALVSGLNRDSFALQVDGKPQALRYFDHDTNVPLIVGLLVDTSLSQRRVLDDERTASAAFLDKMLAPERDKAFLIQFSHTVELLQDVTDSRGKLQAALKQVDTAKPSFDRTNASDSGDSQADRHDHSRDRSQGGTTLYDAVFLASDEVLPKQKGRRALILLTDGEDRGSTETLAKAIEAAQRADTILYAIYYKGESPGDYHRDHDGGGPFGGGGGGRHGGGRPFQGSRDREVDGKKVLERMCGETGGRVFQVTKKQTVADIYNSIAEELHAQYRLGFSPSAEAASEGYHQTAVTLIGSAAKDKYQVQSRDGYYTR